MRLPKWGTLPKFVRTLLFRIVWLSVAASLIFVAGGAWAVLGWAMVGFTALTFLIGRVMWILRKTLRPDIANPS